MSVHDIRTSLWSLHHEWLIAHNISTGPCTWYYLANRIIALAPRSSGKEGERAKADRQKPYHWQRGSTMTQIVKVASPLPLPSPNAGRRRYNTVPGHEYPGVRIKEIYGKISGRLSAHTKYTPPPVPSSYRMAGDEHLSRFLSHGYLRIGEGRADPDFRSGVQVFDRLTRVIS